jgi:NitT/TauT family transport system permease protein
MSATVFALFVFLIPLFIVFQIVNDVLFKKRTFFRFFESLPHSSQVFYTLCSFLFVLSLWSLLSYTRSLDQQFLPTPTDTIRALWTSFVSGELIPNTLVSLGRITVAFLLASIIGIAVGSVAGTFARLESLILPLNSAIRYIPPTAFIAITIIWFGIGEASKLALIFMAILFYIIQMVADTVKLVPKVYIEAAQTLGANRLEVFRNVILGMSASDILAVLRVNLGAAWTYLIVAELVAAQQGLGYLMAISQRFLQTPKLFALLVVVGVLGFISDSLLALAIKHYSKWK